MNSPSPVSLASDITIVDRDSLGNVVGEQSHGAHAGASYGRLRGSSFAEYLNVREFFPFSGFGTGIGASSDFSLDDLEISGPPGNILVSLNLAISGGLIATDSGGAFMNSSASANAGIINFGGPFGAGGMDLGRIAVGSSGGLVATGIFSTLDMGGTVLGTTFSILTFAGAPIQFKMGLQTFADASVGRGAVFGVAFGSSSFTLGFPTSGPVANLPEGYTLNSAGGHIVNNRFVPEPPTFVLAAVGVLGLMASARRRRFCLRS
jgi:hypothetical protein